MELIFFLDIDVPVIIILGELRLWFVSVNIVGAAATMSCHLREVETCWFGVFISHNLVGWVNDNGDVVDLQRVPTLNEVAVVRVAVHDEN